MADLALADGFSFDDLYSVDGLARLDAAFIAVERITQIKLHCTDYQVHSATLGQDALGEVTLEVEHDGQTFRSRGTSTDTVEATLLAILDAVNRIVGYKTKES